MSMPQTNLGGKQVGRMGFGLMQLTWNPTPPPQETSFAAMKAAADSGATAWSTATFYGVPPNQDANLKLIAAFFDKYPQYKDKITLVVKGGQDEQMHPITKDLEKAYREQVRKCQEILGDKTIDVWSVARLPPGVPVEEVFTTLKKLKDEGLFGAVGASETSAGTLRKVQKIVDIAVLEIEVSLWSYEQDIKDAIAWSTENKVPIFAYSPLGRGFITRTWKTPEDIPEGAFQRHVPRFQGEAFYDNLKLVDKLDEVAQAKKLGTPQLALAWILHLSPYTIPIPGSSNVKRVQENCQAATIELTDKDLEGVNEILANFEVSGGRYAGPLNALSMQ